MPRFKMEMTSRHNYFNSDMQPYSMIKVGLIVIGAFSVEVERCGTKYDLVAPNPADPCPIRKFLIAPRTILSSG